MILYLIGVLGLGSVSANILQLKDGEDCTAHSEWQSTCKLLSECKTVGNFGTKQPPICSFKGSDRQPIICCPNVTRIPKGKPGRKLQYVCKQLETICKVFDVKNPLLRARVAMSVSSSLRKDERECDGISMWSNSAGQSVPATRHPYMAAIGFCGDENKSCDVKKVTWGCGGSLITDMYILSAAHCAYSSGLGPAKWARLGHVDYSSSEDIFAQDRRIVEIFVHPKYSAPQAYYNIALFKLESYIILLGYILPVCLQVESNIELKTANFTGWEKTGHAEATSNKLLEAEVEIYNETECRRLVFNTKTSKAPLGLQPDHMICAGVPDGSKDACAGDSGGPLIIKDPSSCLKTQVAITSFGNNCGFPGSPGVYTRVSNYVSWIEEIAFKNVSDCD